MQTKNTLDQLYDMFQERLNYRLDELEIQRTRKKIMEIAENSGVKYEKMESAVLDYGIAYERAGFRNGFRFAAQILAECLNTGPIPDSIPLSVSMPDTLPFES